MSKCVEGYGHKNRKGYYMVTSGLLHREVWEEANGPIPEGIMVRHTCDNPSCINLEHLILGTNLDNMEDMKERQRFGKRAKLTEDDVRQIRIMLKNHDNSVMSIAKKFGVSQPTVTMIGQRKRWSHVI